jgi:hypothetical protein
MFHLLYSSKNTQELNLLLQLDQGICTGTRSNKFLVASVVLLSKQARAMPKKNRKKSEESPASQNPMRRRLQGKWKY